MTIYEPDDSAPCDVHFSWKPRVQSTEFFRMSFQATCFFSLYFFFSSLSSSLAISMAIFGRGTHKIIIRHPTSPRAGKGKTKRDTGGVYILYRLEFFAFFYFFIFSVMPSRSHLGQPRPEVIPLIFWSTVYQGVSNNKHHMLSS